MAKSLAQSTHWEYQNNRANWLLWRNLMEGGQNFVETYVKKISEFELDTDFNRRKSMTPSAEFARGGIIDIKNAIFQRLDAIRRTDGSASYKAAVAGKMGGVDLRGSTMEHFIGTELLEELLFLGRVGVFVDSPELPIGRTLAQRGDRHPYIYAFLAEDIRNWRWFLRGERLELQNLLLRVRRDKIDPDFGTIDGSVEEFRFFNVDENGEVTVQFFDGNGKPIDNEGNPGEVAFPLEINRIPFHLLELSQSLAKGIANHQILLTNLESLDGNYATRSNVPWLAKKFNPMQEMSDFLGSGEETDTDDDDADDYSRGGDNPEVMKVGAIDGIKVPHTVDYPIFINPSAEPLNASMEKQKNLKDDIRTLLNLAISNVRPKFASAESKILDERGLDAGLSSIGLVLEHAERAIAELWSLYEGSEPADVKYPEKYSLRSDEDRRREATSLTDLSDTFVSKMARKALEIEKAEVLFTGKMPDEDLAAIKAEIIASPWPTARAETIRSDIEMGLVSREGGSEARGYPPGEATKAGEEKAERDAAMMLAQMPNPAARGLEVDPEAANAEKTASQSPENNAEGRSLTRGPGR